MFPRDMFRGLGVALTLILAALIISAFLAGRASADTLYISEYADSSLVTYQAASAPPLANSIVAISDSSAQSAAFTSATVLVRLHCDIACHVQVGGTNPTATVTSARFVAGQTEYFRVKPGDKVAVLADPSP